ncbi:MAG: TonB-dependent receptor, partial [Methylococcales bacterium]|nr:TonB-dependent receptor [Methylococcales bacterium]
SKVEGAVNFNFSPASRDFTLYSGFIQDEFILLADRLKFILGSKFEHNDFSGFEFQPNARLVFTPDNKQTIWAAVARAVRIPNRLDHDLESLYLSQEPSGVFPTGVGNSNFDSEQLIAYELGYRIQPTDTLLFDIAAFYNDYDKLTTAELGDPVSQTSPTPHVTIPIYASNQGSAETYGVELLAQWQVFEEWRLQGSYSYLQIQFHSNSSTSIAPEANEGNSPHHQYTLRSSIDLLENVQFDTTVRYVDNLSSQNVESYTELDLRLAWTPLKNLELSVVGQNLLHSHHAEFTNTGFSTAMEVQRGFYGKLSWQY